VGGGGESAYYLEFLQWSVEETRQMKSVSTLHVPRWNMKEDVLVSAGLSPEGAMDQPPSLPLSPPPLSRGRQGKGGLF